MTQIIRRWTIKVLSLTFVIVIGSFISLTMLSHKALAAGCSIPTTNYGTDTLTLNIPSTGQYYLWLNMQAPSTSSNSIEVQLNNSSCFTAGGSSAMPLNTWDWINYQGGSSSNVMSAQLNGGTNTVELIGIQPGVMVSNVDLLSDGSCIPTGSGTNCAPTNVPPPTVSVSSPSNGASVSGSVPISVNAASAPGISQVGISYVVIKVDGNILATDTTSPYTATWNTNNYSNGSHVISVIATDSQGQSTSSSETVNVNNFVACNAAPSSPGSFVAKSNTYNSITLGWTTGSLPSNCSLSRYNLYQNGQLLDQTSANSFTLSANPNSVYNFTLSESDSFATSSPVSLTVTTPADTVPPTNPINPTASVKGSNEVDLSWGSSTDATGIANYRVYRNGQFLASTSSLYYQDNSVSPGSTYSYQISAVDNIGNVSQNVATTPVSVTTPQVVNNTPPSTPTNLKVSLITTNSISIYWSVSTDNTSNVIGYKVYRSGQYIATVNGTSYTDNNLSPNTNYKYSVMALASNGSSSSMSSSVSATTLRVNGPPATICSLDLNHDGLVDVYDGSIMFAHWHADPATCAMGDFNQDNIVNGLDAQVLFSHWGEKV